MFWTIYLLSSMLSSIPCSAKRGPTQHRGFPEPPSPPMLRPGLQQRDLLHLGVSSEERQQPLIGWHSTPPLPPRSSRRARRRRRFHRPPPGSSRAPGLEIKPLTRKVVRSYFCLKCTLCFCISALRYTYTM